MRKKREAIVGKVEAMQLTTPPRLWYNILGSLPFFQTEEKHEH